MNIFHLDSQMYHYFVLPFLIFLARVCDVTIGTVRIMLVARGKKFLSPLLGFIEMLIWLLVVRQIMLGIDNWACYVGFAGGFAMGNFIGMCIEEKIAMGIQVIRIITRKESAELIEHMQKDGFGLTVLDAQGSTGKVNLIFTIVKRSDVSKVIQLVQRFNPKAFYSIEDIRSVGEGVFPSPKSIFNNGFKK